MYINKCVQCGYDYSGSGDSAHVCNPKPKVATSGFTKRPSFDKRIEELAEECYIEQLHERGGRYMAFDKKTFAERIIQDCVDIVDTAEPYKASDLIKKHFGVKQ